MWVIVCKHKKYPSRYMRVVCSESISFVYLDRYATNQELADLGAFFPSYSCALVYMYEHSKKINRRMVAKDMQKYCYPVIKECFP